MTRRWSVPACVAGLALLGALHAQQPGPPPPPQAQAPVVPPRHLGQLPPLPALAPVPQPLQCERAQACGAACGPTLIDPKSTILKAIDTAIGEATLDEDELRAATRMRLQIAVLLELARLHERHGQLAAADHYLRRVLTVLSGEPIDPPPGE